MVRSTDDVQATFTLASELLDRLVADARPRLEAAGLTITERYKRSGFDHWSGFPYGIWEVHFDRQIPHGSEVAVATARLSFSEPLDDTRKRELTAQSIAQIYQPGQQSRVDERSEQRIAINEIETVDLGLLVQQLIGHAYAHLYGHGVGLDEIGR